MCIGLRRASVLLLHCGPQTRARGVTMPMTKFVANPEPVIGLSAPKAKQTQTTSMAPWLGPETSISSMPLSRRLLRVERVLRSTLNFSSVSVCAVHYLFAYSFSVNTLMYSKSLSVEAHDSRRGTRMGLWITTVEESQCFNSEKPKRWVCSPSRTLFVLHKYYSLEDTSTLNVQKTKFDNHFTPTISLRILNNLSSQSIDSGDWQSVNRCLVECFTQSTSIQTSPSAVEGVPAQPGSLMVTETDEVRQASGQSIIALQLN